MHTVYNDLIRFSSYVSPINLSFNQYLLLTDEPVLIHTGSTDIAKNLIQPLKEALGERTLAYIFVSHFESDECGGLKTILDSFPAAKVLCSEVTSRQFAGFGIVAETIPQKGGDKIKAADFELEFITYPSEMHLWDGLLLIENNRKILFSSDLVFHPGEVKEEAVVGDITGELQNISHAQVPDKEKRQALISTLTGKEIDFVAAGHGDCIRKGV